MDCAVRLAPKSKIKVAMKADSILMIFTTVWVFFPAPTAPSNFSQCH
jgi:hypothetical protein